LEMASGRYRQFIIGTARGAEIWTRDPLHAMLFLLGCDIRPPRTGRAAAISPAPGRNAFHFDYRTQAVHGPCMATKTISIETDAYELLAREKRDDTDSFSRVIRRLFAERPALTAGELLDVMQEFQGKGAGPRRKRP